MSDAVEDKLRHQVAAVSLLLNAENILGYSGHVSVRLPGRDDFLIQPVDQSRASLRPEHLLICGMDGKLRLRLSRARPPSEVYIHSEIFRARPDVNAIAHFHHDLTTTFSLVEGVALQPIKNHAVRWESGIPTHPDPSHVSTPSSAAPWPRPWARITRCSFARTAKSWSPRTCRASSPIAFISSRMPKRSTTPPFWAR